MSATYTSPSPVTSEHDSSNLVDLLVTAATQYAKSGAYAVSGAQTQAEFMSYPALLKEAQHILGGLRALELPARGKVALLLQRPRDFMPAFWACVLGGYIPCPIARASNDAERWARHISYVDTLLDNPLFISTGRLLNELPTTAKSARLEDLRVGPSTTDFHDAGPTDTAVLMLTSGSTGNSKAVELTHGNILASMSAKADALGWRSDDIALNWVGFDHVAALLKIHMIALYVGAAQVHVEPPDVLTDPLQFLRLIDRHHVTMAFTPNFLLGQINAALESALLAPGQRGDAALDLSRLRTILVGGEANVVQTGLRFLQLLAPYGLSRSALVPAYGLTETCAGIVYSREFPHRDLEHEFAAVGKPVRGLELRIADESGNSLSPGECGEVQVRGPIVFRGYLNNEEATRAAFTADGWFRTGDLGRIDDGYLSIVARIKDSIIVSGVNYFSHELESQLQDLQGIERAYVAAFPTRPKGADTEQLVVAFATSLSEDDEEGVYQLAVAIRNTTIMLWGFRPAFILPLPKSAFIKTNLGKIQRAQMRKRFEEGAYNLEQQRMAKITSRQLGAYVAPRSPHERGVAEIFSAILGIPVAALSVKASFFELGGTSLDILKLIQALDRKLQAKVELPVILQNPTVEQLAARLASDHVAVHYDPVVPLQTTGRKTPLFCVHPGNSEVLVLVNLAKYFLNDRPFLAFRPRGFNRGEECFATADEYVDTYLSAMLKRQPKGPYALAGYSMGALIAFEMAKQLETRGHEVAFLGLIDYPPNTQPIAINFTQIATAVAWMLDLIDWDTRRQLDAQISSEQAPVEICDQVFRYASRNRDRLTELNLDLEKYITWCRVANRTEEVLFQRVSSGNVRAMSVFRSSGAPGYSNGDTANWHSSLQRWERFSSQLPRFVDVPGDHFTLMSPKHVASFQAVFRAEIERAL